VGSRNIVRPWRQGDGWVALSSKWASFWGHLPADWRESQAVGWGKQEEGGLRPHVQWSWEVIWSPLFLSTSWASQLSLLLCFCGREMLLRLGSKVVFKTRGNPVSKRRLNRRPGMQEALNSLIQSPPQSLPYPSKWIVIGKALTRVFSSLTSQSFTK
jgi:hypothetical protein